MKVREGWRRGGPKRPGPPWLVFLKGTNWGAGEQGTALKIRGEMVSYV